jgi:hypothetical protein
MHVINIALFKGLSQTSLFSCAEPNSCIKCYTIRATSNVDKVRQNRLGATDSEDVGANV